MTCRCQQRLVNLNGNRTWSVGRSKVGAGNTLFITTQAQWWEPENLLIGFVTIWQFTLVVAGDSDYASRPVNSRRAGRIYRGESIALNFVRSYSYPRPVTFVKIKLVVISLLLNVNDCRPLDVLAGLFRRGLCQFPLQIYFSSTLPELVLSQFSLSL